jgi:hypothetical protein
MLKSKKEKYPNKCKECGIRYKYKHIKCNDNRVLYYKNVINKKELTNDDFIEENNNN